MAVGSPYKDKSSGQGALGGLSNLDQRKLNIMYCESAKANLVKTELAKTLRYTLREYEGVNSKAYSKALTTKLGKIYALFQFSITVFDETTAQSEYNFKSNGNCLPAANSQLSGYGSQLLFVGRAKVLSMFKQTSRSQGA